MRRLQRVILAVVLVFAPVAVHAAQVSVALSDAELAALRGGYVTVGGVTLDFGAVTRTMVDGRLALQTELTWSADGARVVQTGGDASGLHPDSAGRLTFVTPDGRSTISQQLTSNGLANIVTNTASGRAITQDTSVTLTLPGFQAVQGRMGDALTASRLGRTVSDALVAAARR